MAKTKTTYLCQECGAESPKWIGKCPACGQWNTYKEITIQKEPTTTTKIPHGYTTPTRTKPMLVSDIPTTVEQRIDTTNNELNRVLGGGLVLGSLVLIAGEPGIGKSTLSLQAALRMRGRKILYVSGEESASQLKMRAERIQQPSSQCYIVSENNLEQIFAHIRETQPETVIIDSIQTIATDTIDSTAGSITQVRECTIALLRFAKETNIPVILIGHINKDGNIAGPKVLEHIVDTVLLFEGDPQYMYRILRATKNRFGSTDEIAIFEMRGDGLREISNPSELLLSHNSDNLSGISVAATVEGIRPFLIDIQALVSTAAYGTPQRTTTGFDQRRLNMLLAVIEKRAGFKLMQKDVFINIAGGLRVSDPAIDLAVLAAILSSNLDITIPNTVCMAGEVGLSGEIRPVSRIEQRVTEAERLGFKQILIPENNKKQIEKLKLNIQATPVKRIEQAFRILFG